MYTYTPDIPLEELTEAEDQQMLELIAKVVERNALSPIDLVGKPAPASTQGETPKQS